MRLAVISDIHNHRRALERCLAAIDAAGVDEIWCLGNVVEGLPGHTDPVAAAVCVRHVGVRCSVKIAGNHEAWALRQPRRALDALSADTVRAWPAAIVRHDVLAVHASPTDAQTEPISSPGVAMRALQGGHVCPEVAAALGGGPPRLTLYGHTHRRAMWALRPDGKLAVSLCRTGQPVDLSGYRRVLLNPGAVAAADPTWMLLDLDADTATWRPAP